jgi:hypothetical protein
VRMGYKRVLITVCPLIRFLNVVAATAPTLLAIILTRNLVA